MSLISELTNVAKNGLKNFPKVIEGNLNRLKDAVGALPEDQKREAERRYNICVECPFNSYNAKAIGFYDTQREDLHCSVCSCPIASKVMSFDSDCGLDNLAHKTDEMGNTYGIFGWKPLWFKYTPE